MRQFNPDMLKGFFSEVNPEGELSNIVGSAFNQFVSSMGGGGIGGMFNNVKNLF